jgi:hypothetical protein
MPGTLILPKPVFLSGGIRREPPRPVHQRQASYDAEYDYTTLFYDAVLAGDSIRLVGPPLGNLQSLFDLDSFHVNNCPIPRENIVLQDANRTQMSHINIAGLDIIAAGTLCLSFTMGNHCYASYVSSSLSSALRRRKCLLTLSKNNPIRWIADWAFYYKTLHDINTLLLYDNNSDIYTATELQNALVKEYPDLDIYVIKWDFPYGPQGGGWAGHKSIPWDSDYCQYGMFEHSKHYLLDQAALVINHDIDELLLPVEGMPIDDFLVANRLSYARYLGKWVTSVSNRHSGDLSFRDYVYTDATPRKTTIKWVAKPNLLNNESLQWKTHGIPSIASQLESRISHRHFKAISTHWKFTRESTDNLEPIQTCEQLVQAFTSIRWVTPDDHYLLSAQLLQHAQRFSADCVVGKPTRIWVNDESVLMLEFTGGFYTFALGIYLYPNNLLGIVAAGCDANSQRVISELGIDCLRARSGRYLLSLHDQDRLSELFVAVFDTAKQISQRLTLTPPPPAPPVDCNSISSRSNRSLRSRFSGFCVLRMGAIRHKSSACFHTLNAWIRKYISFLETFLKH